MARWDARCQRAINALAFAVVLGACGESRANDALPQTVPYDSASGKAPSDSLRADSAAPLVRTSDLRAGGGSMDTEVRDPFADDPEGKRDGRTLYLSMNCAGCHGANGGGGIGPPLSDDAWIYGGRLENIVQTMIQGRPNGMPSYGGRLPQSEMWKIAAYVQSMAKSEPATTPARR